MKTKVDALDGSWPPPMPWPAVIKAMSIGMLALLVTTFGAALCLEAGQSVAVAAIPGLCAVGGVFALWIAGAKRDRSRKAG